MRFDGIAILGRFVVGLDRLARIAAFVLAKGGCSVLLVDAEKGSGNAIGETLPAAGLRILRTLGIKTSEEGAHRTVGGNVVLLGLRFAHSPRFFGIPEDLHGA